MMQIEINGVPANDLIDQTSLSLEATRSKAPAMLTFVVRGVKTMPALGASVLLEENSVPIFSGTIVSSDAYVEGKLLVGRKFVCKDGTHNLDRRLVSKSYSNTDAGSIVTDIVMNFADGFTVDVPGTTPPVTTARFNYEQPSSCLKKLAAQLGWDWWITPDNVVHFQPMASALAPFEVSDTNGNAITSSLEFNRNILELKNVVYVRGAEYQSQIDEGESIDVYVADGDQVTFPLVYRYSNVQATVNGTPIDIGIDNIDKLEDFDALYNFQEKGLRFSEATKPSAGQIVRVFGSAHIPLIVQATDLESIAAYGRSEGIDIDKTLSSIEEAETKANALLEQWREGSSEGSFKTMERGLRVGQSIAVNSALLGINETFVINRVRGKMHGSGEFQYTIEFIKSGQTTFTDIMVGLLGKERDNVQISPDEVIQRFMSLSETFSMTDELVSVTKTSAPYRYQPNTDPTGGVYDFSTYG